ncbi:MAG: hypothetical protein IPF66_24010 [Holophagales bacterium]|nr:hypothetical protein [Holophagales bacterium]
MLSLLSLALTSALVPALAATPERPHLTPWVVVRPAGTVPAAAGPVLSTISVNAPGLLVEVRASEISEAGTTDQVRRLFEETRGAGRRTGLLVELPEVTVPENAREAEAVTADSLVPGLGPLLGAAQGADLFVLSLPDLSGEIRSRRYLLMKAAAIVRSRSPASRIAVLFHQPAGGGLFPPGAKELLSEEAAAFVDLLGLDLDDASTPPEAVREAADGLSFARPLLVTAPAVAGAGALLDLAARFSGVDAPVVAAPLADPAGVPLLDRLGALLAGDVNRDGRSGSARTPEGKALSVFRFAKGTDLGGVVLVTGADAAGLEARGPLVLELDSPSYTTAEVFDLATGRSRSFDLPKSGTPRLSLTTANGPLAIVLTAREKAPSEATRAATDVTAVRGLTVEEILARHQAWRAGRDARWTRFSATNRTSYRFRLEGFPTTFELTFEGPFFYERGKGFDWAWQTTYFNGVKWKGKKAPELPLLQPEKVSELPLNLTFNEAYRYELDGEGEADGVPTWILGFEPSEGFKAKAIYAGKVYIGKADFSLRRVVARQLNLTGEVQSVDETTDFSEVAAPDGGPPLLLPVATRGQSILRTFSRTTTLERTTDLIDVRLDPSDYESRRAEALAGNQVMVRDTDQGVRYLEKQKDGERVVVQDEKTSRLFGLGGVFYDDSFDYPLPLLGLYYIDLDFAKKRKQVQGFFGGPILAGSYNDPNLFGTNLDLGVDAFANFVRGEDTLWEDGEKVDATTVKARSFAANLNVGYPLTRHLKLTATLGGTWRDYASGDDTDPAFAVPSDHLVTRLEGRLSWDLRGWNAVGKYSLNLRSSWDPWGYAGNAEWDEGKDQFQLFSLALAKTFDLPRFQRIDTSVSYVGTSNADRFSKVQFGYFGGTSLRGFRSGSLRAEEAVTAKVAYGVVVGKLFRLQALYDHAVVNDPAAGYDWVNFGGAGVSGQFSGPWSTLVQLEAGLPVVGRNRGQTGFVLYLVFLRSF